MKLKSSVAVACFLPGQAKDLSTFLCLTLRTETPSLLLYIIWKVAAERTELLGIFSDRSNYTDNPNAVSVVVVTTD